ncbi:SPOR domain-containing protein [Grimontia sp. NTOU-MAR1]|uniref:SPOR domain-containing protein n=1 Tax=Grimontia sp. NTOU-MAR1 TaxID=3111011 RepID=UPI002DBAE040|nr:SPOR domain-containing protein [Grimontia sp. NTOU-MAR1]WRV96740.1 SPOR domain-containing protein [Grimontia sp. NTOU-MAR1]
MLLRFFSILAISLLGVLSLSSAKAKAADACSSVERQGWQVVEQSCQVGAGLWSKRPLKNEGRFWVQCGVVSQLPKPWFAKEIEAVLMQDKLVFRQEDDKYRCLVGPFERYPEAEIVKDVMTQRKVFASAFIRDVSLPEQVAKVSQVDKHKKKTAAQKIAKPTQKLRRYIDVGELKSPMPEIGEPRYSDKQNTWWRATLKEANQVCHQDGMQLVSEAKLKALSSTSDWKNTYPSRLPYWVSEMRAFDVVMGISMPLTIESALLVLCEP